MGSPLRREGAVCFLAMRSLPRLPRWGRCGALIYNGVWIVHGLPFLRTRRGAIAPLPSRTSFCEAGVRRTTPCADEKTGRSSLACGTRRDDLPRRRCVFGLKRYYLQRARRFTGEEMAARWFSGCFRTRYAKCSVRHCRFRRRHRIAVGLGCNHNRRSARRTRFLCGTRFPIPSRLWSW